MAKTPDWKSGDPVPILSSSIVWYDLGQVNWPLRPQFIYHKINWLDQINCKPHVFLNPHA